ncbi:MAG: TIGR03936 family radical SAM-associated protein [Oscillospiraceae bacterium]|jgi:radical SAM-linked protein
MDKLRLRFTKTGRAVYISHLDLMRTMQRAFLRAAMPLRYSEGFNPHAQISILLPLSVGIESHCELMDFRLNADVPLAEIPGKLTAALPDGLEAVEAYENGRKSKELKWLRVKGRFCYDDDSISEAVAALTAFYSRETVAVTKKTKRGMGEMDLIPAIDRIQFREGRDCVIVDAMISAQEPTLNPDLLVSALHQLQPELAPDYAAFRRIEVFDSEKQVFR